MNIYFVPRRLSHTSLSVRCPFSCFPTLNLQFPLHTLTHDMWMNTTGLFSTLPTELFITSSSCLVLSSKTTWWVFVPILADDNWSIPVPWFPRQVPVTNVVHNFCAPWMTIPSKLRNEIKRDRTDCNKGFEINVTGYFRTNCKELTVSADFVKQGERVRHSIRHPDKTITFSLKW